MSVRLDKIIGEKLAYNKDANCYWWDGQWYSKEDFSQLADRCETTLRQSGFLEGQRLCVIMQNCPMVPALSVAIWRLGGTICPLNVKSGMASLLGTLELIAPFAVIASDAVIEEAGASLKAKGFRCTVCPPAGPLPPVEGDISSFDSRDTAVIFATSGTTGTPKAVPLSHGNIYTNCLGIEKAVRNLEAGDVFLNVLPNFHSLAYTITVVLPLVMDAGQAIVPGFLPPQQAIRAIQEAPVNVIFAVPALFSYLIGAVERGSMTKDALLNAKALIAGGDRLSPRMHEQMLRVVGRDIVEGYGLTEASPVVAVTRSYEEDRPGTVGPFLEGYEWHLRTEKGNKTDKNEGVLWIRGPSVTNGYFRAPEMTAERFDDGWFNTGDYVRVKDGYLEILDRVTDIIIVGGFNVYPQEVELVLREHPAIQTVIVIGMPHAVNGEVPKAYIQKTEGAQITELEIVKYCKERLAHFKVPRKVEFVDDFPLSSAGKILRRVLRDRERENRADS